MLSATVPRHQRNATALGFGAILLWSSLATLTVASGQVPALELTALTFAIGGALGLAVTLVRGRGRWLWPSLPVLLIGVCGLFGDYALYFGALRLAPPPQSALIVALWPLLMVLLAGLVLGEPLRFRHGLSAVLGLTGVIVVTKGSNPNLWFELRYAPGYALAFGAAIVWAGYSVLSRRHHDVPTETVTISCLVAAALAALGHLGLERTVIPSGLLQSSAIVAMGLGPAGAAFFAWDHGVKHGDLRLLAILGYAEPVLSTLMLIATGIAAPTTSLGLACVLIVIAGVLATAQGKHSPNHSRASMLYDVPG